MHFHSPPTKSTANLLSRCCVCIGSLKNYPLFANWKKKKKNSKRYSNGKISQTPPQNYFPKDLFDAPFQGLLNFQFRLSPINLYSNLENVLHEDATRRRRKKMYILCVEKVVEIGYAFFCASFFGFSSLPKANNRILQSGSSGSRIIFQ